MPDQTSWIQIALWGGQTVLILILLITAFLKFAPRYEKIRLRELDVREAEAKAKEEDAKGRAEQGSAMVQVATVLNNVAIEQRRATETIELLQRFNADSGERLEFAVRTLSDRQNKMEEKIAEMSQIGTLFSSGLIDRVEKIEKSHVQSERTRT